MSKFSNKLNDFGCNFIDLIDPKISFDYLGDFICLFLKNLNGMIMYID